MKRGEKAILAVIVAVVLGLMGRSMWHLKSDQAQQGDQGIPFYSTASELVGRDALALIRDNGCKQCHSLWTVRDVMQAVPAPILDGLGSLRSEEWFFQYFSATNPQAILPSRLKKQYRMPSYAHLSESQRRLLASYMASLKVKDWYLAETRKAEYEKLTGKTYPP
jgi:cbb3-type cytochrome oxidase cytochrome c subunit